MNRLPRRTSRIKPPLRGRLAAAVLSPRQQQKYSEPLIRKRPVKPKGSKNPNPTASYSPISQVASNKDLPNSSDLNQNQSTEEVTTTPSTSKNFEDLWKNLLTIAIVMLILSILINSLL